MIDIYLAVAVLFLCAAMLTTAFLCMSMGRRIDILSARIDIVSMRADTLSTRADIIDQRMNLLINEIKQARRLQ